MDPYDILFHPYVTEKTMNLMEKKNALEFVVKRNSNKKQIKKAIEKRGIMVVVARNIVKVSMSRLVCYLLGPAESL